jgi:hypothetical protein
MTHAELLRIAISFHATVLIASLAAWYKYGDRTDVFAKSLTGTDFVLSRLRMMISDDLKATIKEYLSTVTYSTTSSLVGLDGKTPIYSEKIALSLDSEDFRDCVRDFMNRTVVDSLSDYRVLKQARENWCFWARILSWLILLSIILQVLFLATHGFVDCLIGQPLPNWTIHTSLAMSGSVIALVFILPFPILLRSHDIILKHRARFDAP